MENYILTENKVSFLIDPFPREYTLNIMRFQITKNTKFGGLIGRINQEFQTGLNRKILLSSIGDYCSKCVSCVEVLKKKLKPNFPCIYQWTELYCSESTDTWVPNLTADKRLDPITVSKYFPEIFIIISLDPFPENFKRLGQQSTEEYFPSFLQRSLNQSKPRNLRKNLTGPIASSSGDASSELKRVNKWKRPAKLKQKKESNNTVNNSQNN